MRKNVDKKKEKEKRAFGCAILRSDVGFGIHFAAEHGVAGTGVVRHPSVGQ